MTTLTGWLGDLEQALGHADATPEAEQRLDALIDQGVSLLATAGPSDAVDATVIERVQRRLRAMADTVATELDDVRRTRHELTKASRAHAGYRAAIAP